MIDNRAVNILSRWKQQCPGEASLDEVVRVVSAYLSDLCREIPRGGSHLFVIHSTVFEQLGLFDGNGQFTISHHNKRVKKAVIKDILTAIDTLEMIRKVDRE